MISCIVFDFDGTLVNSNAIKRQAFFDIVSDLPGGHDTMQEIVSQPAAGSRYEICERFADKTCLSIDDGHALAQKYSQHCSTVISQAEEMPGAMSTLEHLRSQGYHMFVSSATPSVDLKPLLDARNISRFFDGSFGMPSSKVENLQKIAAITHLNMKDIVVVGDGLDDYLSAFKMGCSFVPVFNAPSAATVDMQPLQTLTALPDVIKDIQSS